MSGASIRIETWKAQRTVKDVEVPSLTIVADVEAPDMPRAQKETIDNVLERHKERYRLQAKEVVWAMLQCLPGGMVDAILGELFEHKRSVFIVPHGRPIDPGAEALNKAAGAAEKMAQALADEVRRWNEIGDIRMEELLRAKFQTADELAVIIRDLKESK